jgi:hypothetical protein
MHVRRFARASSIALLAAGLAAGLGCKRKTNTWVAAPTAPAAVVDLDGDPTALLPYGSLLVANLDAKQIANSTLGGDLTAIGERVIPIASQIDFQTKRDLDRIVFGAYAFSGADALAVLRGRFDPAKIEQAAQRGLNTPMGVVVASTYAGRRIYTVANVGFTVLTARTAFVGTEAAIRRALDRIQAGVVRREMAPWMAAWVTQPGYPVLLASDVTKQAFGKTVTGFVPWIAGVQYVRVGGRFNPDGSFGMSGALTYPDPGRAQQAATSFETFRRSLQVLTMLKLFGLDPVVRSAVVQSQGSDMQFSTVLDEKQARTLVRMLSDWLGGGGAPGPTGPQPGGTTI